MDTIGVVIIDETQWTSVELLACVKERHNQRGSRDWEGSKNKKM